MTSTPIGLLLLYFSIVSTTFLVRERRVPFLGCILIGSSLLTFDLPDSFEYKEHYQIASQLGISHAVLPFNFEPGYNLIVSLFSKVVPYEAFYVFVISITIYAYIKAFDSLAGKKDYLLTAFLLSIFLYFFAFTVRTTIASMFLAYAVIFLKNRNNFYAALMVIAGCLFHVVIAPLILFPVINIFSSFVTRNFKLTFLAAIIAALLIASSLSLDFFLGRNNLLDLKIMAYNDANIDSKSIYFWLWIFALFCSLISIKYFSELDRVLVIGSAFILLLLLPFGLVQGRMMWLMSFILVYILTKATILRFSLGPFGGICFVVMLPLIGLVRY